MEGPSEEKKFTRSKSDWQGTPSIESLAILPYTTTPSEEELATLRRMGGKIEASAWLVALFSGAERFAFYALQAPLRK